jgi:hypothetical protein
MLDGQCCDVWIGHEVPAKIAVDDQLLENLRMT